MSKTFRIISMVPSWTELLVSLNIPLVGRTRFCIEPKAKVTSITAVGGTKDWNLDLVESLTPDLIILDKDENPKFMSEGHNIPFVATHVHDIPSCIVGIQMIATAVRSALPETQPRFDDVLNRWHTIATTRPKFLVNSNPWDELPGLIQWIKKPAQPIQSIHYLIWKNPWMQVTRETFIGDVTRTVGLPLIASSLENRYPQIDLKSLDSDSTLLLFSSEPYPFHKKTEEFQGLPFAAAIVDGQNFSWFGTHALEFLEKTVLR